MTTTADDVWQLLGELVTVQKETERILKEQSQETERRFVENMVAPACETFFQEAFSVKQIYIDLRAYYEKKTPMILLAIINLQEK